VGGRLLDRLPALSRLLARLGNPLRSEAAAFRWLCAIVAVVALVTVAMLAIR
jgi:hypothetical protein